MVNTIIFFPQISRNFHPDLLLSAVEFGAWFSLVYWEKNQHKTPKIHVLWMRCFQGVVAISECFEITFQKRSMLSTLHNRSVKLSEESFWICPCKKDQALPSLFVPSCSSSNFQPQACDLWTQTQKLMIFSSFFKPVPAFLQVTYHVSHDKWASGVLKLLRILIFFFFTLLCLKNNSVPLSLGQKAEAEKILWAAVNALSCAVDLGVISPLMHLFSCWI